MALPTASDTITLAGSATYQIDEAYWTLVGYAFGPAEIPTKPGWDGPIPLYVRRWAYQEYDCVPASEGDDFRDLDLLVLGGLNARPNARILQCLRLAGARAADPLARARKLAAEEGRTFWDLDLDELGRQAEPDRIGAHLTEAWRVCVAVPNVNVTRAHKLLHHKAPDLVPLIDRVTEPALIRAGRADVLNSWQVIHADLQQAAFAELETRFGACAADCGEEPLTRLRIHDILLWLDWQGQRASAAEAGRDLIWR